MRFDPGSRTNAGGVPNTCINRDRVLGQGEWRTGEHVGNLPHSGEQQRKHRHHRIEVGSHLVRKGGAKLSLRWTAVHKLQGVRLPR